MIMCFQREYCIRVLASSRGLGDVYMRRPLNVLAVGADTCGVHVVPAPEGGKVFYSHVILLRDHGIYILETMDTGRLVEQDVNEFMFVLGQAKVRGTVQMIINPVALW